MKTQEQRFRETIDRVKELTPELKTELKNCIETGADVRNFLVRDGKIRSRGRGSPWIGSVEHVKNALSASGGGVIQDPAPQIPPVDSRRVRPGCFIAAISISLVCFGLALIAWMRAVSPQPAVEGKRTTDAAVLRQESETAKAEHVPGAAPVPELTARSSGPSDTAPTYTTESGAAPVQLERERLLAELDAFLSGGELPVTDGETLISPFSVAPSALLQNSLNRVGMAFGLSAYDDAVAGVEAIGAVRLASTKRGLVLSLESWDPDRSADAVAKLLAVTPGCSVGGLEVEVVHRPDGIREIMGPARHIRVNGIDGRIRWGNGEVTLVLSKSGVRW